MKKHNLLIVDDEPYILKSLVRALENPEMDIFTAGDANAAWELLKEKGEIEVVLCDNRLPGMAGIDLLIKIKQRYPDTIRILMTGYPDINSSIDAINRAHIWRYVLKPIEVDDLKVLAKQAFDYYGIVKENRILLKIARQQADLLKQIKGKYPDLVTAGGDDDAYSIDEKKISDLIEGFMKKYYPEGRKE